MAVANVQAYTAGCVASTLDLGSNLFPAGLLIDTFELTYISKKQPYHHQAETVQKPLKNSPLYFTRSYI